MAVPEIDSTLGLLCYSTKFPGTGGRIRESCEDFQVAEVLSPRTESSIHDTGDYPVYLLKKSRIDTNHALSGLYKKTGLRLRSLGLKDSNAVTVQYVYSGAKTAGLEEFKAGRYSIRRLGYTKSPLSKKHMTGNRFRIRVSGSPSGLDSFDEYRRILNFYGYQRFGSSRPVTHLVGKSLIQGRYADAVDYILSFTSKHDTDENTKIRREMGDLSRLRGVYGQIPPRMDLERRVAAELIEHGDAFRAIRSLPVQMRRFYVQAYQSYLFNLTLSRAFDYGEELFGSQDGDVCYDGGGILGKHVGGLDQSLAVPVVGHSYYKKTRFHFYISKILEREEVLPKDFFIKEMQEAGNEGGFRRASVGVGDFSTAGGWISFFLSRGSFATVVMREIIKPAEPLQSGF